MVKEIAVEHSLFADSMLETSLAEHARRGWSTLSSFGMQFVVIGLVILLSILKSVVMPAVQTISTPVFLSHLASAPTTAHPRGASVPAAPTNPQAVSFMQPSRVPTGVYSGPDNPSFEACNPCDAPYGATDISSGGNNFPTSILNGNRVVPVPQPTPHPVFRTSNLLEGSIVRRVQPVYPPLARTARVQGPVVLAAIISKEGTIENLRLLSGHPMLVPAALEAVKQWRYKPYILNGDAIEVETQITVNFSLGGN